MSGHLFPDGYTWDRDRCEWNFVSPRGFEGPARDTIEEAAIDAWRHRATELEERNTALERVIDAGALCINVCPIFIDRLGEWAPSAMLLARQIAENKVEKRVVDENQI